MGVRVLTVDDQATFRGVAREVIDATPGFDAIGEAASGEEALLEVERLRPELVLIDVRMPGLDGVEVAQRLRSTHPATLLVLVSTEDPIDLPSAAETRRAASPFVRKQASGPGRSPGCGASTGRDGGRGRGGALDRGVRLGHASTGSQCAINAP